MSLIKVIQLFCFYVLQASTSLTQNDQYNCQKTLNNTLKYSLIRRVSYSITYFCGNQDFEIQIKLNSNLHHQSIQINLNNKLISKIIYLKTNNIY
ncbi:unnamed protein product [Paramecium primaurelia]|uniref:Transmembrane protein n=1 Tax=Paramecium primaurelia TaxID=5886 RepID=A0A8S1NWX2_PARPR|nr:unnamed protein product [Paramecium primaurelia]